MRSTKQLVGKEGMEKLFSGINKMADAVKSTLGPMGRNVLIQDEFGNVRSTKDGVSVAKALYLQDPLENLAATILREVSVKTNDVVGDGTTTAMVLAQGIIRQALLQIKSGVSPTELKKNIDADVEAVCAQIDKMKVPVTLEHKYVLASVAAISTNNDREMGEMLADAFIAVGEGGLVTVQEGKSIETYFEHSQGISFQRGYLSSSFINNQRARACELDKPAIILVGEKISQVDELFDFIARIGKSMSHKPPFLLICDDIDEKVLSLLILNKLKGILDITVIKGPGLNLDRRDQLEDIAVSVGAKIISKEHGHPFRSATIEDIGFAESIKITDNNTTILGGQRKEDEFNTRVDILKGQIDAVEEQFLKDRLTERIAKLKGGIGVIYAGGSSEFEIKEKMDRIDDGIHALQAVLEEGVVSGGGAALLHCEADTSVIDTVLEFPLKQMLVNADFPKRKIDEIIDSVKNNESVSAGFDVKKGVFVTSMIEAGVMDSAKVVKSALRNAASVATLFITTEYVIANTEYKEEY